MGPADGELHGPGRLVVVARAGQDHQIRRLVRRGHRIHHAQGDVARGRERAVDLHQVLAVGGPFPGQRGAVAQGQRTPHVQGADLVLIAGLDHGGAVHPHVGAQAHLPRQRSAADPDGVGEGVEAVVALQLARGLQEGSPDAGVHRGRGAQAQQAAVLEPRAGHVELHGVGALQGEDGPVVDHLDALVAVVVGLGAEAPAVALDRVSGAVGQRRVDGQPVAHLDLVGRAHAQHAVALEGQRAVHEHGGVAGPAVQTLLELAVVHDDVGHVHRRVAPQVQQALHRHVLEAALALGPDLAGARGAQHAAFDAAGVERVGHEPDQAVVGQDLAARVVEVARQPELRTRARLQRALVDGAGAQDDELPGGAGGADAAQVGQRDAVVVAVRLRAEVALAVDELPRADGHGHAGGVAVEAPGRQHDLALALHAQRTGQVQAAHHAAGGDQVDAPVVGQRGSVHGQVGVLELEQRASPHGQRRAVGRRAAVRVQDHARGQDHVGREGREVGRRVLPVVPGLAPTVGQDVAGRGPGGAPGGVGAVGASPALPGVGLGGSSGGQGQEQDDGGRRSHDDSSVGSGVG